MQQTSLHAKLPLKSCGLNYCRGSDRERSSISTTSKRAQTIKAKINDSNSRKIINWNLTCHEKLSRRSQKNSTLQLPKYFFPLCLSGEKRFLTFFFSIHSQTTNIFYKIILPSIQTQRSLDIILPLINTRRVIISQAIRSTSRTTTAKIILQLRRMMRRLIMMIRFRITT